jgi:hypothetical protein
VNFEPAADALEAGVPDEDALDEDELDEDELHPAIRAVTPMDAAMKAALVERMAGPFRGC